MNHKFKKSLGQNFISDKNLLEAIVSDAQVTIKDVVIEVGVGSGNLTTIIADRAKKVIAFEVDNSLKEFLDQKFLPYKNLNLIMKDILKVSTDEIKNLAGGNYKVVANLPYYITTPIIFKFLEDSKNLHSLTIMVQEEVAKRITAAAGTPNYGALTVMINYYGNPKITRLVNRKMFYPVPNVDSAVVRIDIKKEIDIKEAQKMSKLVQCAFQMRRKTLANNISQSFEMSKEEAIKIITQAGFDSQIRGEKLTQQDFAILLKHLNI